MVEATPNWERRFVTDQKGNIPPNTRLEPSTEYVRAWKQAPAAYPIQNKDEVIGWIRNCVFGDLQTLANGISEFHKNEWSNANGAGGNFLMMAGCCMALEYLAYVYQGKDDSISNVREYTIDFLAKTNPRYHDIHLLLVKSFRNGIVHGSWPQVVCVEGSSDWLNVSVGVEPQDLHLVSVAGHGRTVLAINAVQFMKDLRQSADDSFFPWILESSDPEILERAAPRLLTIRKGDKEGCGQVKAVFGWAKPSKP